MSFCTLESDEKTFEYLNLYGQCFEQGLPSNELDNRLQAEEIRRHLYLNGHPESNQEEKIRWVITHGKAFRDYINTIKLIYISWTALGHHWSEITWEDMRNIEDRLNSMKEICLDTIF